jgi:hypothetical protein
MSISKLCLLSSVMVMSNSSVDKCLGDGELAMILRKPKGIILRVRRKLLIQTKAVIANSVV